MIKDKKKHFKDISTPLFIIGSVLLVGILAGSIIYSYFLPRQAGDLVSLEQMAGSLAAGPKIPYEDPLISNAKLRYPKVLPDDPRIGEDNALVTIFVFSDFTCSACRQQQVILNSLIKQYPGDKVRLVWKGVATTPVGMLAQQAGYCAQAQGKFWPMAEALFARQGELSRQLYSDLAEKNGLNVSEFDACLDQAQRQDKVYDNNIAATDLGIKSLPYFFIDNTPYEGVLSELELKAIITLLLNK